MAKYFLGSVGSAEAFRMVNGKPQMAFVAKTLTDSSISVTITKVELRGGTGAPVVTNFFHDPAVAITLTDILFKEGYVEAQLGTHFSNSASAYQSETITAEAEGELTLKKVPVDLGVLKCSDSASTIIAWYSEEGKDDYKAVSISSDNAKAMKLKDNGIESGKSYCVRYLASDALAREAVVKSDMIPHELALIITVPIFAGDACAASKGSKAGTLTFEVPRFQLDGGQEFTFNMSSNAPMNLNGTAMVMAEGCDANSGKLFRIIEVMTDGSAEQNLKAIAIDPESAQDNGTVKDVAVYALYNDKTLAMIPHSDSKLKFTVGGQAATDATKLVAGNVLEAKYILKEEPEEVAETDSYTVPAAKA